MLTLKTCSSGWTPASDAYNGLANSRFHTLLFGINSLRSDELPHCRAKNHCSGAFVQLCATRISTVYHPDVRRSRALTMERLVDLRSSDAPPERGQTSQY